MMTSGRRASIASVCLAAATTRVVWRADSDLEKVHLGSPRQMAWSVLLLMRKLAWCILLIFVVSGPFASAEIFGRVRGVVHDPQHCPLPGALVTLRAARSQSTQTATTGPKGDFLLPAAPLGEYTVTITAEGFRTISEDLSLSSNSSPLLHFQLQLAKVNETVTVTENASSTNVDSVTPTTSVNQIEIARMPGGDRTNASR